MLAEPVLTCEGRSKARGGGESREAGKGWRLAVPLAAGLANPPLGVGYHRAIEGRPRSTSATVTNLAPKALAARRHTMPMRPGPHPVWCGCGWVTARKGRGYGWWAPGQSGKKYIPMNHIESGSSVAGTRKDRTTVPGGGQGNEAKKIHTNFPDALPTK